MLIVIWGIQRQILPLVLQTGTRGARSCKAEFGWRSSRDFQALLYKAGSWRCVKWTLAQQYAGVTLTEFIRNKTLLPRYCLKYLECFPATETDFPSYPPSFKMPCLLFFSGRKKKRLHVQLTETFHVPWMFIHVRKAFKDHRFKITVIPYQSYY